MSKVSVEYAHIYTNQHVSEEHELSIDILTRVRKDIESEGKKMSLAIMIDDYSFPDPSFDYDEFLGWLDSRNSKPNVSIRESQLIPACDEVLRLIEDSELKVQLVDYVKAKKYPCSLFIAAWYLLRLGKISSAIFPKTEVADEILNILPKSFKPFEDKGLEIIEATKYRETTKNIRYKFLPGRLIA